MSELLTAADVRALRPGDRLEVWAHPEYHYGNMEIVTVDVSESLAGAPVARGQGHVEGNRLQTFTVLPGSSSYRKPGLPPLLAHQRNPEA